MVGAARVEGEEDLSDDGDGNNIRVRPRRAVAAVLTMLRSDRGNVSIDGTPLDYALCAISAAAEDEMPNQKSGPRYRADITAGSLKVTESRRIADLLLRNVDADGWNDAIVKRNVLQARTPATARRLASLIRSRLESMGPDLWKLVRDGKGSVATHAVLAAAVKHSPLLGDFLGMVVADQYRRFGKTISNKMLDDYLDGCRERDPLMPAWKETTGAASVVGVPDARPGRLHRKHPKSQAANRPYRRPGASLPEERTTRITSFAASRCPHERIP